MLYKLAPVIYLVERHSNGNLYPRAGMGQEIGLRFVLRNILFSKNRKVDAVQTFTINVSLDDRYPNSQSYPQGWGGVKK